MTAPYDSTVRVVGALSYGDPSCLGVDTYTRADDRLSNPYLRLNGLADWPGRSAYFLDAERGTGSPAGERVRPGRRKPRTKDTRA